MKIEWAWTVSYIWWGPTRPLNRSCSEWITHIRFGERQLVYRSLTTLIDTYLQKFYRYKDLHSLIVALTKLNFVNPRITNWIPKMQNILPTWPRGARLNDKSSEFFQILNENVSSSSVSFFLSLPAYHLMTGGMRTESVTSTMTRLNHRPLVIALSVLRA